MPSQKVLAFSGVLATALAVAVVESIGGGIGDRVVGVFEEDPPLVTSSATEEIFECGTQLFVPAPRAEEILSSEPPADVDWNDFHRSNRAGVAGQNVVEVSIQGESSRTITLTRIDLEVERRPRQRGAVFSNPCGDAIHGRSVRFDLDRRPPAIVASTEDPEGIAAVDAAGRSLYKPIRFPWTVSVTDPLLLRIVGQTKRCDCRWRASITWRSGGESGRIAVDNDGKGYRVVGGERVRHYSNGGAEAGWQRYPSPS
ncbi:MAG: hypothetical protein ACXW08_05470 [Solirubrobacteraceae bacterium]